MSRDSGIDAYIGRAVGFARPILTHLRDLVHAACPEVEEALKWSAPAFLYNGRMLCNLAAFKAHAAFGFWRHAEVTGGDRRSMEAMGSFGRLTDLADLPDDATIIALIHKAMALTDSGAKPARAKHPKPPIALPEDLAAALSAEARAHFDRFSPSRRREYVEWITGAKRPETRARRIAQAAAQIAEGKPQNWKYGDY